MLTVTNIWVEPDYFDNPDYIMKVTFNNGVTKTVSLENLPNENPYFFELSNRWLFQHATIVAGNIVFTDTLDIAAEKLYDLPEIQ